ncbi:MAG: type III secretion chaperone [Parachlamydiales bacterium]|nr:type III secretion chaperone [Parachlamydiales bacterium]
MMEWAELFDWSKEQLDDLRCIGFAYIKQGHYDIALDFFHALNIINPHNAYDMQTLGALYLQKGKALEALHYIDQALKIQSQHHPSLLNRAKALFLLGYKKQAITQAKELLSSVHKEVASQASILLSTFI